jgi:chromate transporter
MTAGTLSDVPPVPTAPSLLRLALTFGMISSTAFGGGQMTSMRREIVARAKWMSDAEFVELLSIGSVMPGPNPINMSVLVGYRFHGVIGAASCLLATTLPAFVILMLIAALYYSQPPDSLIHAAFRGCAAAVVGINVANAYEMTVPYLRVPVAMLFIVATAVAVSAFHLSLELVMLVLAPLSIAWRAWRGRL